jgi:hypothetical protein
VLSSRIFYCPEGGHLVCTGNHVTTESARMGVALGTAARLDSLYEAEWGVARLPLSSLSSTMSGRGSWDNNASTPASR